MRNSSLSLLGNDNTDTYSFKGTFKVAEVNNIIGSALTHPQPAAPCVYRPFRVLRRDLKPNPTALIPHGRPRQGWPLLCPVARTGVLARVDL